MGDDERHHLSAHGGQHEDDEASTAAYNGASVIYICLHACMYIALSCVYMIHICVHMYVYIYRTRRLRVLISPLLIYIYIRVCIFLASVYIYVRVCVYMYVDVYRPRRVGIKCRAF